MTFGYNLCMSICKHLEWLTNQGISWCDIKSPCFPNCQKCDKFSETSKMTTRSVRICQTTTLTTGEIAVSEFEPGQTAAVGSYRIDKNGNIVKIF